VLNLHPKIKAVVIASVLAVLGVVGAHVADLGLSPEMAAVLVAVISSAAGYLKRA
jgi:hypothetical protein